MNRSTAQFTIDVKLSLEADSIKNPWIRYTAIYKYLDILPGLIEFYFLSRELQNQTIKYRGVILSFLRSDSVAGQSFWPFKF